jgi:hypothetical protein
MFFTSFLSALVICAEFGDILGDVLQISLRDSLDALSKREGTNLQISARNHLDGLAGQALVRRQGSALQITPHGHPEGLLRRTPVRRRGTIIQISPCNYLSGLAGQALTKRQGIYIWTSPDEIVLTVTSSPVAPRLALTNLDAALPAHLHWRWTLQSRLHSRRSSLWYVIVKSPPFC